jgi:hypothetical protein
MLPSQDLWWVLDNKYFAKAQGEDIMRRLGMTYFPSEGGGVCACT